ncbi:PREDICTED: uncharacterized protein LOC109172157 [Ipomoea nil]|uniref:uncharacterized protein LOC109172157 n=1 Tax=Ipomoea nil TaxID=35883 RepID=UPI000900ED42|nr:PREDICTED: uncharacterized protein LOC109172157 [Ipomoea nil]
MGSTTSSTTSHPIVFLLLLSLMISQSCWHVDGRGIKTTIFLNNQLPQESDVFKVHCFSKDNDLGYHDVSKDNSPFAWSFSENFWGTTLFACHFWWGSKDKAFDVFGGAIHPKIDPTKKFHAGKYYYYVRSDAFYLSHNGNPSEARKVVTW